ncbi:MAG: hypothetical protein AAEJ04_03620, partial [Planctomycetota bacterium]
MGEGSPEIPTPEIPSRGQEKLQVPDGLGLELAPLLDTEFVKARLLEHRCDSQITIESCRVRHLRFHPGKDSLVAYDVKIRRAESELDEKVHVFARCESATTFERELRRATSATESSTARKPGRLLEGVVVLAELRAMLIEFPHDSRLPHLAVLDQEFVIMNETDDHGE